MLLNHIFKTEMWKENVPAEDASYQFRGISTRLNQRPNLIWTTIINIEVKEYGLYSSVALPNKIVKKDSCSLPQQLG